MVGICGFGVVGQAVYSYFSGKFSKPIIYDKYKEMGSFETITTYCDKIFVCLPTIDNGKGQDFSEFRKVLDSLVEEKYGGVVIIKSTILYSNIQPYLETLNIVLNPEFLNQHDSIEDIHNRKITILGGDINLSTEVSKLYLSIDSELDIQYCTVKEAIYAKYMHNIYHAYKVLFWNYVNEQMDGDHRKISKLYKRITGNQNEMDNVAADGKMGFGGACFPKDLNSFNIENPHELTKFMLEYNRRLRGKS